jgi:integrase
VLSASLVQISRRCGREGCHCSTGEKHVGHYLTRRVGGKTRTVYVPEELVEEVRKWVGEHKRLKQLVQEITELSIARVRGHVRDKKRKRKGS